MGSSAEEVESIITSERVLVVGTGALACLFAARLSASGRRVGMLGSWPAGLSALRERGVCLVEGPGEPRAYPVQASADPADFAGTRQAVVLVKTWQTARAAQQLAGCLHPDGVALTLQNGLGNLEILAESLGPERSAVGVTTLGASLLEPGCAHTAGSGEVFLGKHPRLGELETALRLAGLALRVETALASLLWGKLVINAAANPVSALLGLNNGGLLEREDAMQLIRAAVREAAAVADVLGISLPYPDPVQRIESILRGTAHNRSSMLQDLERGAPTEIEAINGAVIRAARETGLDAPVNQTLYWLVKAKAGQPVDETPFTKKGL